MAIWKVDIEKALTSSGFTEYWTNVYHVDAGSLAAAQALADAIVLLERAAHYNVVNFTRHRVQQSDPLSHTGSTKGINALGNIALAGAVILPLFNVCRVDLQPASGRPSRKYLRMPIPSAFVDANGLTSAFRTVVQTGYLTPLLATSGVCDPQGQPFIAGTIYQAVAMRQLRRGRKRRTPVLP